MSDNPYMKLYIGDFLRDTTGLGQKEVGAYLLILMAMWCSPDGRLPNDDKRLKRTARGGRDWAGVWADVRPYFHVDDEGFLCNKRLLLERKSRAAKSEANSANGVRGAEVKALKRKEMAQANASVSLGEKASHTRVQSPEIPKGDKSPTESQRGKGDLTAKAARPPPPDDGAAEMAVSAFNRIAGEAGWPMVKGLSITRQRRLIQRIAQAGGLAGWIAAIRRGAASSFLRGDNERGWKADFDFFLQESSFTKLTEGSYDWKEPRNDQFSGPARAGGHAQRGHRAGGGGVHQQILDGFAAAAGVGGGGWRNGGGEADR